MYIPSVRIIALLCVAFVVLSMLFNPRETTEPREGRLTRSVMLNQMGESYIILQDFDNLKFKLKNGAGQADADPLQSDRSKATLKLERVIEESRGMLGADYAGRHYVFGVGTLDDALGKVYSILLVFDDDGRTLGFVSYVVIGEGVSVSGIDVGPRSDGEHLSFPIRIKVMERAQYEGAPLELTRRKVIRYSVNASEGTLAYEAEEAVGPNIPAPLPSGD